MINPSKHSLLALSLLMFVLCLTACDDDNIQPAKQQVHFTLTPPTSGDTQAELHLPENTNAKITVVNSSGTPILQDVEIGVDYLDGFYTTHALELIPGAYSVTDFVIVKDSVELYVVPKKGAELTSSETDALPLNFQVDEINRCSITMPVVDVTHQDIRMFGYASAKTKANSIEIAVRDMGSATLINATAELRQHKKLLGVFSLRAAVNSITLGGDSKSPYTLTVYTANAASVRTFTLKELKKELGKNPLHMELEPALVLSLESYVDEGNEYEEYFDFRMEGNGAVAINWGDGEQSASNLPFEISHEYFSGQYKAIVTGDINGITDFTGFSYSTIMTAITGLTNLTALKVYDPSWGAVPIKVDLSNCKQLERINVAKYGAPYEPCDLRTEFKLPSEHFITAFIFDATSFDINREFISAEELDVMVSNIYTNAVNRSLYNGKFFVHPVVTPSPATQAKIDVLKNVYNWRVGFNDEIYNAYEELAGGRQKKPADSIERREQWLRERFANAEPIIERAPTVTSGN